eukprot:5659360-Amphidinium_carterae.3
MKDSFGPAKIGNATSPFDFRVRANQRLAHRKQPKWDAKKTLDIRAVFCKRGQSGRTDMIVTVINF